MTSRLLLVASLGLFACAAQGNDNAAPATNAAGQKLRHLPDYDHMAPLAEHGDSSGGFKIHDFKRPLPKAVVVGEQPSVPAPADAVKLFDGTAESLAANWAKNGWSVKDGILLQGGQDLTTARAFGDCQLHVEWRAADKLHRDMCNSGVLLMGGRYEVQIIDSAADDLNAIPADAMAGALYGWMPPLANPMRPAGNWNSYDIVFRRPRFEAKDGKAACVKFARATVVFNGVLVQDDVEIPAVFSWLWRSPVKPHADKLPFSLQSHGGGVEFRNVWARELE